MTNLDIKIVQMTQDAFVKEYCSDKSRFQYWDTVRQLFGFAYDSGARTIFVGGSFITDKHSPSDIDVFLAYHTDKAIPVLNIENWVTDLPIDMQLGSYEDAKTLDAYIFMFSHDRDGSARTVIQIDISSAPPYKPAIPDEEMHEFVMATYTRRHIIRTTPHKGILVSIHGLYSTGDWNVDLAPILSSQGWIFAPYVYNINRWPLLFNPFLRKKTVEDFREWIFATCERYKQYTSNLSVAAHSYGTYIIGAYLNGYDQLPVNLNSVVLTGSVLNKNYNWKSHFDAARVGSVLNIYSPGDWVIRGMPNHGWKRAIGMDRLFGSAGYSGFSQEDSMLIQKNLKLLHHTNGIKRDIVEKTWMPFLNNNFNSRAINERTRKK